MEIELADLLGVYPSVDTPNLQTIIGTKKEFFELEAVLKEQKPTPPEKYFRNQKFVHRYMRTYDDLLLLDDTGTGKTRSVGGLTEYYHENKSHIKGAFIIVSGKTQKQEFTRQLSTGCSDVYIEKVVEGKSERAQRSALGKEIGKWYKIMTYQGFWKFVNTHFPLPEGASPLDSIDVNRALKQYFSGYIFFIDEVQNIKIDIDRIKGTKKRADVYSTIWRVFKLAESCKRIIASATPMMNRVGEIVGVLNLILPIDRQLKDKFSVELPLMCGIDPSLVTFYDVDVNNPTIENMKPFLHGRISYIKASDSGAVPLFVGTVSSPITLPDETVFTPQQKVDPCLMTEHQSRIYKSIGSDSSFNFALESSDTSGSFGSHEKCCNFTFPDGSYGGKKKDDSKPNSENTGFYKYMIYQQSEKSYGNWVPNETFKSHIRGDLRPNLQEMSAKAHRTVNLCLGEGKTYIYCSRVKAGGVLTLGACLQVYGFDRFRATESVFANPRSKDVGLCPFLPTEAVDPEDDMGLIPKRKIKDFIKPYIEGQQKYRYAVIDRTTSDAERAAIFELFNSPENVDGIYIKVVLVSPVGQFGISLFDIRRVILYGPEWSPAASYQSMTRAFRALSHEYMLLLERDKLIVKGLYNGQNVRIDIPVHFLASYVNVGSDQYQETIESIMYKKSELKDIEIKRMMRIMKQASVNCFINRKRNVRLGTDGTQECDYLECQYHSMDPEPTNPGSDTSTYDVYYSDGLVSSISDKIIQYFRYRTVGSISDFYDYISVSIPDVKDKYIIMALESIVENNTKILDRYGFHSYLKYDMNIYYLSRIHPRLISNISYSSEYYSRNLIGVFKSSIQNIISHYETSTVSDIINSIINSVNKQEEITRLLFSIDPSMRAKIFEHAVTKLVYSPEYIQQSFPDLPIPTTDYGNACLAVIDYFKSNSSWIRLKEPLSLLKAAATKTALSMVKGTEIGDDIVWIHNIDLLSKSRSGHSSGVRYINSRGTLKILKQKDGVWREIESDHEMEVYSRLMSDLIKETNRKKTEMHEITGTLFDNQFKLLLQQGSSNSGMACTSYDKVILWNTMYNLKVPAEVFSSSNVSIIPFANQVNSIYNMLMKKESTAVIFRPWENGINEIYKYILRSNIEKDAKSTGIVGQINYINNNVDKYPDLKQKSDRLKQMRESLYKIIYKIDPSITITYSELYQLKEIRSYIDGKFTLANVDREKVKQDFNLWNVDMFNLYKELKSINLEEDDKQTSIFNKLLLIESNITMLEEATRDTYNSWKDRITYMYKLSGSGLRRPQICQIISMHMAYREPTSLSVAITGGDPKTLIKVTIEDKFQNRTLDDKIANAYIYYESGFTATATVAQPVPQFNFGGSTATATATSAQPVPQFNFGRSTSTATATSAQPVPQFNFGGSTATVATTQPVPQFNFGRK